MCLARLPNPPPSAQHYVFTNLILRPCFCCWRMQVVSLPARPPHTEHSHSHTDDTSSSSSSSSSLNNPPQLPKTLPPNKLAPVTTSTNNSSDRRSSSDGSSGSSASLVTLSVSWCTGRADSLFPSLPYCCRRALRIDSTAGTFKSVTVTVPDTFGK